MRHRPSRPRRWRQQAAALLLPVRPTRHEHHHGRPSIKRIKRRQGQRCIPKIFVEFQQRRKTGNVAICTKKRRMRPPPGRSPSAPSSQQSTKCTTESPKKLIKKPRLSFKKRIFLPKMTKRSHIPLPNDGVLTRNDCHSKRRIFFNGLFLGSLVRAGFSARRRTIRTTGRAPPPKLRCGDYSCRCQEFVNLGLTKHTRKRAANANRATCSAAPCG